MSESQELTFSFSTIRSLKTRGLRRSSRSTGEDLDLDFKFWSLDFGFGLGLGCRGELADYYTPVGWSEVLLETKRDNTESNLGNLMTDIMMGALNADCALINAGTLRSNTKHPKGEFRLKVRCVR